MTITDDERSELYQRLKETMGERPAGTLMAHLPPVGWADVATKQDLALLKQATKQDLALLKQDLAHLQETMATKTDLADLRSEMHQALRSTFLTVVATNITLFGLAVATVRWA